MFGPLGSGWSGLPTAQPLQRSSVATSCQRFDPAAAACALQQIRCSSRHLFDLPNRTPSVLLSSAGLRRPAELPALRAPSPVRWCRRPVAGHRTGIEWASETRAGPFHGCRGRHSRPTGSHCLVSIRLPSSPAGTRSSGRGNNQQVRQHTVAVISSGSWSIVTIRSGPPVCGTWRRVEAHLMA